jgi:hypothetical protein
MKKKLLFLAITVFAFSTTKAQTLTNLVFQSTITATETKVTLKFDYAGVVAGDTFEWQLFKALADGSPDWGSGRNIAYKTAIVPPKVGTGTETIEFDVYNTPVVGEIFTWTGKITLGSNSSDVGYNNTGNLVTISNTASVNDFNNLRIGVYPNPSSDFINISNDNLSIKNVQIYNVIGKKVADVNVQNNETIKIDISNFSIGIYLVSTDNNSTAKFIKQ